MPPYTPHTHTQNTNGHKNANIQDRHRYTTFSKLFFSFPPSVRLIERSGLKKGEAPRLGQEMTVTPLASGLSSEAIREIWFGHVRLKVHPTGHADDACGAGKGAKDSVAGLSQQLYRSSPLIGSMPSLALPGHTPASSVQNSSHLSREIVVCSVQLRSKSGLFMNAEIMITSLDDK